MEFFFKRANLLFNSREEVCADVWILIKRKLSWNGRIKNGSFSFLRSFLFVKKYLLITKIDIYRFTHLWKDVIFSFISATTMSFLVYLNTITSKGRGGIRDLIRMWLPQSYISFQSILFKRKKRTEKHFKSTAWFPLCLQR